MWNDARARTMNFIYSRDDDLINTAAMASPTFKLIVVSSLRVTRIPLKLNFSFPRLKKTIDFNLGKKNYAFEEKSGFYNAGRVESRGEMFCLFLEMIFRKIKSWCENLFCAIKLPFNCVNQLRAPARFICHKTISAFTSFRGDSSMNL